jgi:hypothetical protein
MTTRLAELLEKGPPGFKDWVREVLAESGVDVPGSSADCLHCQLMVVLAHYEASDDSGCVIWAVANLLVDYIGGSGLDTNKAMAHFVAHVRASADDIGHGNGGHSTKH